MRKMEQARKAGMHVVCVRLEDGFAEEAFATMSQLIQDRKPDKYEFLGPTTFMVYFKSRSNGENRSKELMNTIEAKRIIHSCLSDVAIGSANGEMIASFSLFGRVIEGPYGEIGNQAMKQAKEKGTHNQAL